MIPTFLQIIADSLADQPLVTVGEIDDDDQSLPVIVDGIRYVIRVDVI